MNRKKILWLCSWYPSPTDPFNGDFIQRHAKAAALYNDIYVLHISGAKDIKPLSVVNTIDEGLTEKIILYKNRKGIIGKLINHFKSGKGFYTGKRQASSCTCACTHEGWINGLVD
jgi:hypothetical protein